MTSTTYLIVGATRGIGFAFAKSLSANKANLVIGTARSEESAKKLQALGSNVKTFLIDMQDTWAKFEDSFKALESLAPNGIDVFIHNAGIAGPPSLAPSYAYDVDTYKEILEINVGGPAKSYKAAYQYIFKGEGIKKIVLVSSSVGQMGHHIGGNAYSASKAALNHFGIQVSQENAGSEVELIKDSVTILLCPGLVDTDFTAPIKHLLPPEAFSSPEKAVSRCLSVIEKITPTDTGKFFTGEGETQPFSTV
ncbi:NAD(P)-binding protein [Yamadazyma tenuis ATCC 10573]|uniref:NAD(P)-binding protein n=1 Tax=Candida tenuis (strain ATCC 10573 / BCRC 21748 / CBS 615 / JCM 9827 / NBRC 10315 / NRRL Y-1498 / VKM Y-70) TaxID=590646 RepID=G3B6Q8_CANTC|nr:NAD(P)-binding protein [Yamadazyma tenuis ATCC 10573]EGV62992.1 NAD(P)-binding protein [Yamadazyma tenuis ATCC 10573]